VPFLLVIVIKMRKEKVKWQIVNMHMLGIIF
jgi:hypothetical protein